MGRPATKADLITASTVNFEKLNTMMNDMTEQELSTPFHFEEDPKKKRLTGKEIRTFGTY